MITVLDIHGCLRSPAYPSKKQGAPSIYGSTPPIILLFMKPIQGTYSLLPQQSA